MNARHRDRCLTEVAGAFSVLLATGIIFDTLVLGLSRSTIGRMTVAFSSLTLARKEHITKELFANEHG